MKVSIKRSTIVEAIAFVYIILFLYTGVSKWLDYELSVEQVSETPLFEPIASLIIIAVPLAEIIIAVMLFWPSWRRKGLYAATGLMILFIVYILYIFSVDKELPCSCGGIIEMLSWEGHLIFNTVMVLLGGIAIWLDKRYPKDKLRKSAIAYS